MTGRTVTRASLLLVLLVFLGLRVASIFTVAFNWDEFAVFERAALALERGELKASGHAGLTETILLPFVRDCRDEIAVARAARALWLVVTLVYVAGIGALLWELFRKRAHRLHDAALGTALLGLLPAFLEWSLQVRTDQIALAGAAWGGAALLASRRRPALALCAGLCLGIGSLSSQKAAYIAALLAFLAVAQLVTVREWRPRREIARALLAVGALCLVMFAYHGAVSSRFALSENHPKGAVPTPALVQSHLDVFEVYRNTIGYSQYIEMLPTLAPHAVLLALLIAASLSALRRRTQRAQREWIAAAWGVLGLGVAVGAFHAAAFAYFWMTLGLFLAVALAIALEPIRALLLANRTRWLITASATLWIAIALPAALHAAALLRDTQAVQRESLAFVRRNFAPNQAGFHPESGLFCQMDQPFGTWMSATIYARFGREGREENTRALLERFREKPLHYLVQSFRLNQFPVELRRFWAENYQPYRASVFVAGRHLEGAAGETSRFEIVVPGRYRWLPFSGPQAVRIDDQIVEAGATLALEPAEHRASFSENVPGGLLVLALNDPPGPAPLSFYKAY
jgi:hypothetical protein